MTFLTRSGKALSLVTLMLAVGCSPSGSVVIDTATLFPSPDKRIVIESDPPDAVVYVMGEKVGLTPLWLSHDDVFPHIYPKERESLYGKVTLKKEGCSDFTTEVSANIINGGLHAELDCGDLYHASSGTSTDARRTNETVEQRLDRITDLQKKGKITEEEAKKARERVLNGL